MKRLIAVVLMFSALVQVAAAKTVYVDAVNGNDGNAGTRQYPLKSLKAAAGADIGSGDIICALPGRYTNEVMEANGWNFRVVVPAGVTLVSDEGAAVTSIEGVPDPAGTETTSPYGCGSSAVGCVVLGDGAVVRGFTLTNGHAPGAESKYNGAACRGTLNKGCAVVDCVISGNVAGRGGALFGLDYAINCRFYRNRATDQNGACGHEVKNFINCYFATDNYNINVFSSIAATFVGCTSLGTSFRSNTAGALKVVNSLIGGSSCSGCAYEGCLLVMANPTKDGSTTNATCRIVTAEQVSIDVDGMPVKGANVGLDAGDSALYEQYLPAIWKDTCLATDALAHPRIMNGRIDVGAIEYDWRGDFANDLAVAHVTVTDVSLNVVENADGLVELRTGASLAMDWEVPAGATGMLTYSFDSQVDGGVLYVFLNGGQTPAYVLSEGTHTTTFSSASPQSVRFVFDGAGSAVLSEFSNCTTVKITDASTGLVIEGAQLGVNEILSETAQISVSRNVGSGRPERLCLGVNVNGVFYSFDGETEDRPLELTIAPGDPSVAIEAVYSDRVRVYVKPGNGDSGDGYTRFRAKTSLSAVTAAATSGQTVYALPGVYSNDFVTVSSQRYRAQLAAGVALVSTDGPESTTILGAPATTPLDDYGAGSDAVSCVYFAGDAKLEGFTVAGGRRYDASQRGGAVRASTSVGTVTDCVFTNNVAQRGGASENVANFVRCHFFGNRATGNIAGAAINFWSVCNCVFDGNFAVYDLYVDNSQTSRYVLNCTFGPRSSGATRSNISKALNVYNSVLLCKTVGGSNLHNCLYMADDDDSAMDASCKKVSVDEVGLTADYRPVFGHCPAIDAGDDAVYAEKFAVNSWLSATERDSDLYGNVRSCGARLDLGAVELDRGQVVIADVSTGLTVTGASKGVTEVEPSEELEVCVSRNFSTEYRCTGIRVNGAFISFDEHDDDWVWRTMVSGLDSALNIEAVYATKHEWYVDAMNGNDDRDGFTPARAVKTLKRAMSLQLVNGDVVHALPGVYREGEMAPADDSTSNRVVVAAGVELVADDGPAVTVIEGFKDAAADYQMGPMAVRGCKLLTGAVLRGFTVRNGGVNYSSAYGDCGGGVKSAGYVVDCVVTNNHAMRGGGVHGGTLVRTFVGNNTTPPYSSTTCNSTANDAFELSAYDSIVLGLNYAGGKFVNCTLLGSNWGSGTVFENCILKNGGSAGAYRNCIFSAKSLDSGSVADVDAACQFGKAEAFVFDAAYRPVTADSVFVDEAVDAYYDLPARFIGGDAFSGQRIYNGRMDIGAGEYDWRGAFSKILSKRRLTVTEASSNVTNTASVAALCLSDGASLAIDWEFQAADTASFLYEIQGDGELTVRIGDSVLVPTEHGKYTFPAGVGTVRLTISFAGTGMASISSFTGGARGIVVIVR